MYSKRGRIIICIASILLLMCVYIVMKITLKELHEDKEVYNEKISYAFENIKEMKISDLVIGDIVKTEGYLNKHDNGGAMYEIVTYDEFYENLPNDIKAVSYRQDKWGLGNPVFEKTPVDEYGNHTLNNGLVAKLVYDDIITPEQWGCIGDGETDNTEQLIHMFAHIKKGYIKFNENSTYLMKSRTLNKKGILDNDDRCNLNEYLWLMCGALVGGNYQGKPTMANIDGVILDGNGCTIKIDDNDFCKGTNDFGIFQFAKSINNLEVKNFNFDGNAFTQSSYTFNGEVVNMRNTNHTLVYLPGTYKEVNGDLGAEENTLSVLGIDIKEFKSLKNEFSNVNIHDNYFKNSGTSLDIQDGGGDFVLIINPDISHDIYIENNIFENWGRWVFSVDLGGNGERFENYKFNNNTCIQNNNNITKSGKYRGLGWIDFEAKKCWKDIEVSGNVVEGLDCFAINGAGEKSENITFNNNKITRINRDYKSAYQYFINFYGVQVSNFIMRDNILNTPYAVNPGYTVNGLIFENNFIISPLQLKGLYGDISINNNKREDKQAIVQILGLEIPTYIYEENLKCTFKFTNNIGGIKGGNGCAMFFDPNEKGKYSYIELIINGNDAKEFNLAACDTKKFTFDPAQFDNTSNNSFVVRGATFTNPTYFHPINNPVKGCGIYKKGDIISKNVNMTRMEIAHYYKNYDLTNNATLVCTEKGYLPSAYVDIYFNKGDEVSENQFIYTDTDLYVTCNKGVLGSTPNHKEGIELSGEVRLLHLYKLAKFEVVK